MLTNMEEYGLAPDVFACVSNGQLIFLDLKTDQYFGCDREKTRALIPLLRGVLLDTANEKSEVAGGSVDVSDELDRLIARGALKHFNGNEEIETTSQVVKATCLLLRHDEKDSTGNLTPLDAYRFFLASARSSLELKHRTLHAIVARLKTRKSKFIHSECAFDFSRAKELTARYSRLRAFYTRPYLCLFDSLSLIEFLSHYRVFPTWIYGVTAEPFHAHCWVQEENVVFNEEIDIANQYTPIMTV